jgi:hypothetical protein
MRKPQEPQKPWPPVPPYLNDQVREDIGPIWEDEEGYEIDEPYYPEVTITMIEEWAATNGIEDPRTVTLEMHPRSHDLNMVLCGKRTITAAMKHEANAEYQAAMKEYNEVTLPAYQAAEAKYAEDLRAYYKWKHDNV